MALRTCVRSLSGSLRSRGKANLSADIAVRAAEVRPPDLLLSLAMPWLLPRDRPLMPIHVAQFATDVTSASAPSGDALAVRKSSESMRVVLCPSPFTLLLRVVQGG